MLLAILSLITSLVISAVAIFYSVTGLATIFAASVIPIVIMGSVLEVGKLITAVWLHRNWQKAVWWLKTYLTVAVIILMFITSMGIFGYLSKSHIEQASASDDQIAKIQILDENIVRLDTKIKRWDDEITRLSSGDIGNTRVDNLINREEDALNKLLNTIDKEKSQYRTQATTDINAINDKLTQYRVTTDNEITSINEQLKTCFSCADERQALTDAKSNLSTKEDKADNSIVVIKQQLSNDLRNVANGYSSQLNPINARINELKTQSSSKTQDIDERVLTLETSIGTAQLTLSTYREDKSVIESQFRKLEAEVGPVKYIAEFIYDKQADRGMLEEAVRWVIVTIIFVFDPLAVLLLIASQYSFAEHKHNKPKPPTIPPTNPPKRRDSYKDMVGKTFKGKYNEADAPNCNDNKELEKAVQEKLALIKDIFKGAQHEEDVADTKIPVKPKAVKKKKKVTTSNKIVTKTPSKVKRGIMNPTSTKYKVSDKDVDVITDMIEKVSDDSYISYENKMHRKQAFAIMHPEFITDVNTTVDFGVNFPENIPNATLFLRTDFLPVKLFRFNGESWVELHKRLLKESAYSRKYIKHLIEKINEHDYDKVLLDAVVAEGVDHDTTAVFNEIELKHINNFKV
jgi:TolA-binding protein